MPSDVDGLVGDQCIEVGTGESGVECSREWALTFWKCESYLMNAPRSCLFVLRALKNMAVLITLLSLSTQTYRPWWSLITYAQLKLDSVSFLMKSVQHWCVLTWRQRSCTISFTVVLTKLSCILMICFNGIRTLL